MGNNSVPYGDPLFSRRNYRPASFQPSQMPNPVQTGTAIIKRVL
jgi:hypothetical protein